MSLSDKVSLKLYMCDSIYMKCPNREIHTGSSRWVLSGATETPGKMGSDLYFPWRGVCGWGPALTFVIILVVYLEYSRKLGVEIAAFWITQAPVSDYKQI